MLGGQPNNGWQLCFALQLHAAGSDLRFYYSSHLKTYLQMRGLRIVSEYDHEIQRSQTADNPVAP